MKCDTSAHAKKRIRERMGTSSDRMFDLAQKRGVKRTDVTGSFRRYLDGLYCEKGLCPDVYVYNNGVFLFVEGVLVTVLSLPTKYHSTMARIKVKGRNEV